MLVITRKADESIVINGNIEVTIVGITRDGVRLGINAPRDVQIHRREVFDAIVESNKAAKAPEIPIKDAAALIRAATPKVKLTKNR